MNERCAIALREPCARANETLGEQFWAPVCHENRWLSTMDFNNGMPVWHASVDLSGTPQSRECGTAPLSQWDAG